MHDPRHVDLFPAYALYRQIVYYTFFTCMKAWETSDLLRNVKEIKHPQPITSLATIQQNNIRKWLPTAPNALNALWPPPWRRHAVQMLATALSAL